MKSQLKVSEAIAEGFTHFGYKDKDWQHMYDLNKINDADIEEGVVLFQKEPFYTASISAEEIADLVTDHIESQYEDNIKEGDPSDIKEDIKSVDFGAISEDINKAVSSHRGYLLTDIEVIKG